MKQLSKIIVNGLRLRGYHGVLDQEHRCGNHFVFDLSIEYDFHIAAMRDDIDATINYAEVVEIIESVNAIPSRLLENVAYRLNQSLRERWPDIGRLDMKISKPNPPIGADLGEVAVSLVTDRYQ